MSINTSNLVTTANGLAELARVQSLNAKLFEDHREISLQMLFPYIVISQKTVEEVEVVTSSTDVEVQSEAAWARVDVCQVQSYSREDVTYRDFTIGALLEIKNNIGNARTAVLFCKTRIVDARSNSRKASDGNRTATDILDSEYGYTVNQLPFAYTELLDSDGNVNPDGITIGAAKFGRARHRMLFNYIIDNNSGIADNITVDDNVYPYSDGYLSKRAFEEGLKRYEEAVSEYQAEYEKFANGSRLYYENVADAMRWAHPQHEFVLLRNEAETTEFPDVDIQAANQTWGIEQWPTEPLSYSEPDSYAGFTPEQYGTPYGDDGDRADYERAMLFELKEVRNVEWSKAEGTTENIRIPVFFKFMFYIRKSLPTSEKIAFVSTYHVLRYSMQFKLDGSDMYVEGEIPILNDGTSFAPSCPSVGKIRIDRTRPSFSLLAEVVNFTQPSTNVVLAMSSFVQTYYIHYAVTGQGPRMLFDNVEFFKSAMGAQMDTNLNISGKLALLIQPNTPAGYTFAKSNGNMYCFGKDFDLEESVGVGIQPSFNEPGVTFDAIFLNAIFSNLPIHIMGNSDSGIMYSFKDARTILMEDFDYNITDPEHMRLVGDFRLHNARVFLYDGSIPNNSRYVQRSKNTIFAVLAFINNKFVVSGGELADITPGMSNEEVASISYIEIVNVESYTNYSATQSDAQKLRMSLKVHYKAADASTWHTKSLTFAGGTTFVSKYVAIEDYDGNVSVIEKCLA